MALRKAHIPGFGNWDVVNNDVVITEYFDIARAGREKREGNVNKHAESHSRKGPDIQKSSNTVGGSADIINGKKQRFGQRGGDDTARQPEALPRKPSKSSPGASGAVRASTDGQVLMHQAALKSPTASQKLVGRQRVPAPTRPTNSVPLGPKEKEVYQVYSGTRKESYQRGLKSRKEMGPSTWARKEYGGNDMPNPSSIRPSNVRKEFQGSRTPSPSIRPSNGRKGYGWIRTPSPSCIRLTNDKLSSNKSNRKKPLPKFGDWDPTDPSAGIAFSSIFDDARNEKKGAVPVKTSSQTDAATPIDEDLYKQQSFSHKKHGERLVSILCKIFSGKMICQ